jgi:bacterial leucyl aminopeptidase
MNKLIFILIALSFFACDTPKHMQVAKSIDTIISKPELADIIDTLSNDFFEGRGTGSEGINKAAIYIENYLKECRIKPYFTHYCDSFEIFNMQAFNVIGLIEGNDSILKNEYIIISAHYDHEGKITGSPDSVYNGANDNASGVSTILNIAKIISSERKNKRSIIVALYAGEELGLTGSQHFAEKIKDNSQKIYCAANIDMIGSILTSQKAKVYISGYKKSNMAQVLNKYIGTEEIVYWPKEEMHGIFGLSDNYPIYNVLNVPSHTFCTFDFDNYPYYHQLDDEIDKIDMNNTLIVANNICTAIRKLSESKGREIKLN